MPRRLAVAAAAVIIAATATTVVAKWFGDRSSQARAGSTAARFASGTSTQAPCPRSVSVVVATQFKPVVDRVAADVATGSDCVRVVSRVADGVAAAGVMASTAADVWISDDVSWRNLPSAARLATATAPILATSPMYFVLPKGEQLPTAARSWVGLSDLLSDQGRTRLTLSDPAASGDGMVAAGALSTAVYGEDGPLESALYLMKAWQVAVTTPGPTAAWPHAAGQIGIVSERAIITSGRANDYTIIAPNEGKALLRVAWNASAAAVADPSRSAALNRLRSTFAGPIGIRAIAAAGFRGPASDANPPAHTPAVTLPPVAADLIAVTPEHYMNHVLSTWHADRRRANILVVIDVSGSMAEPAPGAATPLIDVVRAGVQQLNDLMPSASQVGLWQFGSQLQPPRDYQGLVPTAPLSSAHRRAMTAATVALAARATGTGLYDTVLAAYRAQQGSFRADMPNEVLIFTDGKDQDDPGAISLSQLRHALAAADPTKRVQIGLLGFGNQLPAKDLQAAMDPVGGQVDILTTAQDVLGAFVHAISGGLSH